MTRTRLEMKLTLCPQPSRGNWPARSVQTADAPALAALMLDAYRGTVDDEGETAEEALAEVNAMLDGKYGPWLADASFVVELDGRLVAACVITLWRRPWSASQPGRTSRWSPSSLPTPTIPTAAWVNFCSHAASTPSAPRATKSSCSM